MDISAIFKAVLAPGQERDRQQFEGVRPGDQLTAKIVRIETDGRLLIDLGRFRALAQTDLKGQIQPHPGQTLQLTVERIGTPLQLRLEQASSAPVSKPIPEIGLTSLFTPKEQQQALNAIWRLVGSPHPASVQQALVHLGLFLVKPSADASVRQWIDALRVHLTESGHLFEARMAELADPASPTADKPGGEALQRVITRDLKPNLLILKEALAESRFKAIAEAGVTPKDIETARRTVDRLLSHVELQQERAVQRAGDQDPYQVFAHLLPVKENPQPVRLKIYYPRKQAGDEGHLKHRIALLLDMDRLGSIRADVGMDGNRLYVRFYVSDQGVQDRFEKHVRDIETVLSESFEQVDITTTVSEEKIEMFEREDHLGPSVGRVDLKA